MSNGLSLLLRLPVRHLARRPLRALLGMGGITIAVSLVVSVQLSGSSYNGAFDAFSEALKDDVRLELVSRNSQSLKQSAMSDLERASPAGLLSYAPLYEGEVLIRAHHRRTTAWLVATDSSLRDMLVGKLRRLFIEAEEKGNANPMISQALAQAMKMSRGDRMLLAGPRYGAHYSLDRVIEMDGSVAGGRFVFAPTPVAWQIAQVPGPTRVLLRVKQGREEDVSEALENAVGPGVEVRSIDTDGQLLSQATSLNRKSTNLFSVVSIILGALLAYSAIHMALLERRRELAELRVAGAPSRAIVLMVVPEVAILALVGCIVGLALGSKVLYPLFSHAPPYLDRAFHLTPRGEAPILSVMIAAMTAVVAAVIAMTIPIWRMLQTPAAANVSAPVAGSSLVSRFAGRDALACLAAIAAMGGAAAIVVYRPSWAMGAVAIYFVAFAVLTAALAPAAVRLAALLLRRASAAIDLAAAELRSNAARTRPLLAVVALTVAGSMAILGSVGNLEDGAEEIARADFSAGTVWVVADRPHNELLTARIDPHILRRLPQIREVGRVVAYMATFFDWHNRRVRAFAYGRTAVALSDRSLIEGDRRLVEAELSARRGLLISPDVASELGVSLGDRVEIPVGGQEVTRRLSGIVSNFGWPGGTLQLGPKDFREFFGRGLLTAARIETSGGATRGRHPYRAIRALANNFGLRVETASDAARLASVGASAALAQLREIALLFLLMAMIAVAGTTMTAVAQRKEVLAALHALGISSRQLRATIVAEMGLIIGVAILLGSLGGLGGQLLILKLLAGLAGFPLNYRPELLPVLTGIGVAAVTVITGSMIVARVATRRLETRLLAWE